MSDSRYVFAKKAEDNENFWDVNPELGYLTPYDKFIKKEGKRRSSNIMKAVWLVYDPKSPFVISGERSEGSIKADLAKNMLKDPKFSWGSINNITTAYTLDVRTKIEKEMYHWLNTIKERRVYADSLPWDSEAEEKDKLLKTQKTYFDQYLVIEKEISKEREDKRMVGGAHKSLLER